MTDESPSLESELKILEAELRATLTEKENAVKQIRALRAIVYHLTRIGFAAETLSPFVSVLGDIQKEFEASNFKPLIQAQRHAACAAAVDYLRDHADVPLKEALSMVSRLIDLDATQLDDLRKNLRKNRGRPEARAFYDSCMQRNRALFDSLAPALRKTAVLKSIAKIVDRPSAHLG
ncbi:MAG TPA: hypothetical protein VNX23_27990 [Bradyrhizobium sp.]|jgi:hypothetical protein|uniref:hypothetical protein n=1 Tax=Bradyrhizobium sp. TaxID=376 RepID=UPI002B7C8F8A|nr:hypothetical protein [Bradyrhizobium sp.]HXB81204.1 hypothetical protein [Bradyrhizobium sp.]